MQWLGNGRSLPTCLQPVAHGCSNEDVMSAEAPTIDVYKICCFADFKQVLATIVGHGRVKPNSLPLIAIRNAKNSKGTINSILVLCMYMVHKFQRSSCSLSLQSIAIIYVSRFSQYMRKRHGLRWLQPILLIIICEQGWFYHMECVRKAGVRARVSFWFVQNWPVDKDKISWCKWARTDFHRK